MKRFARLAVVTVTLCSFSAQSIGAASFGPLAGPGAARLAFQAANPAKLPPMPKPKAAQPKPKHVDPKVVPPSEFAHFEDALGELLLEEWLKVQARWEAFKQLVGPDPLPLKAVDLDEALPMPARIELPKGAETFAAAAAAAPEPAASIVAREPARPKFRERPRVERKVVRALPPLGSPYRRPQALYPDARVRRLPSLVPTPWAFPLREREGFAPLREAGDPVLPRLEGRWFEGDGVRFRIVFLHPIGVSGFSANGVSFTLADGVRVGPHEKLPERYWGSYPVYARGQRVNCVVEVENTGKETLDDVRAHLQQEAFEVSGGAGPALREGSRYLLGTLKPGERRALRGWFELQDGRSYRGALEQTHAQVSADAGEGPILLSDEPQAGLIGPPIEL